jgi:hypothetical protein
MSLNVRDVLSGWAAITKHTAEGSHDEVRTAAMYLLVLDPGTFDTFGGVINDKVYILPASPS